VHIHTGNLAAQLSRQAKPPAPPNVASAREQKGEILISWNTLLRPHAKTLALGLLAVIGETIADLLQPWTLKIVFDNVLKSGSVKAHGWLNQTILATVGNNPLAILRFAAIAALAIAIAGAICSYWEKYLTTSVGQWVMHDLRRTLYSHIQRLSLSYHDHKQTGDLLSRVTSDIDVIQSFVASGVLGAFVDTLMLAGMVGVMLYVNWRFTLIALSVAPFLFAVVFSYTRRIKKASREVRSAWLRRLRGKTSNKSAWKKRAWKVSRSPCARAD